MPAYVSHVRYVALAVPDLLTEAEFFETTWGLTREAEHEGCLYFAARGSAEPFILRLRQTAERRTDLFALAALSAAHVDQLHDSLTSEGVEIVSTPAALEQPGGGYGFRFFDFEGRLVEVSADVAQRRSSPPEPRSGLPLGLSHVVFHAPDVSATVAWYEEHLGLKVSDWLDQFMCFMRGHGPKHHCMAFVAGAPTLNHVAFELANMDEMMRGMGRMMKARMPPKWGPGRHTAGDNSFAYFNSPAGFMIEYTAEVESLPEDWTPRSFPRAADVMDQWGTGRLAGPADYPPLKPDPALWVACEV
ncbi:oxidoreductase [Sphingomonas populi]|uniref:Oxidoreductase n=1 Tax=Sphingomonas populi TaxID=2484750 RepID=A0A4V2DC91_9SPHN|nr:VOC family protein [Sphingomonas populi]RZF60668.1 oxidoreductase [Sphingomonas populi]